MEVLRSTNLNSIEFDLDTDIPSQEFLCDFYDNDAASAFMAIATSNTAGVVTLTLPSIYKKYDAEFDLTLSADGDELVSTNISLRRPYVEPSLAVQKLNITLEEATEYERVARMVIDSKTGGFRFFRTTNDYIGTGADYLTIPDRLHKLYAVYENGELIWDLESEWDFTLQIGRDRHSVTKLEDEDKKEYSTVWRTRFNPTTFPQDWDYEIDAEYGWKSIPQDVQEAALIAVQDISCGNLRFSGKYISEAKTDGYDIKYSDYVWVGTGNKIVDDLLAKYTRRSFNPRIL